MRTLLYLDQTQKTASRGLDGGSFQWPDLKQGDTLRAQWRWKDLIEGEFQPVYPVVKAAQLSLGFVDQRPTSGDYNLEITRASDSATEETSTGSLIGYDDTAANVKAALDATTMLGGQTVSVEKDNGSWIVQINSDTGANPAYTIKVGSKNNLRPTSFVTVREYQRNGLWVSEIRLKQAPVASVDLIDGTAVANARIVPSLPSIARYQAGSTSDGVSRNEIQHLTVSPAFVGSYVIRLDGVESEPLSREDTPATILEALEPLKQDDPDAEFTVILLRTGVVEIEFEGSYAGEPQSLMTTAIYEAPEGDLTTILDLDTGDMDAALRESDEVEMTLELQMTLGDADDATVAEDWSYEATVTVERELNHESLRTSTAPNWLTPLSRISYTPHGNNNIAIGDRHTSETIGNGAATTFTITHNFDSDLVSVKVFENSYPGAQVHPDNYTVNRTSKDELEVSGFPSTPTTDQYIVLVTVALDRSWVNDLTVTIAQVTGLQTVLDDYATRLTALEAAAPSTVTFAKRQDPQVLMTTQLRPVFRTLPLAQGVTPERPQEDLFKVALPSARPGGLLPAIHTRSAAAALPLTGGEVDEVASGNHGVLYENQSASDVIIPGAGGRPTEIAAPGDYVTAIWFDEFEFGFWYVLSNYDDDGGDPEASYYPRAFDLTLFEVFLNTKQLTIGREAACHFAFRTGILAANTKFHWSLSLELGEWKQTALSEPGDPDAGPNIEELAYLWTPVMEQSIIVMPTMTEHVFGFNLARTADTTFDFDVYRYGMSEAAAADPATANVGIRARLIRGDTEDGQAEPEGFVLVDGLTNADFVGGEGFQYGKLIVK